MDENRRIVLRSLGLGAVVLGTPMVGLTSFFRKDRLRPPCALDEHDLLASCIKCGQCIQVCPVQALKPGGLTDGFGIGVPFLDPRKQACDFSCDVIQCALACPTGALSYHKDPSMAVREGAVLPAAPVLLAKVGEPDAKLSMSERMGVARFVGEETCLAKKGQGFQGKARGTEFKGLKRDSAVDKWKPQPLAAKEYDVKLCDLCVRECPIQDAIRMNVSENAEGGRRGQPIVTDRCVGCGVCEMVCPTESASIRVEIRGVWA